MRKRYTLRPLDGFEKNKDAVNQTKDAYEKIQLVLQSMLRNILIHALRKSFEYEFVKSNTVNCKLIL